MVGDKFTRVSFLLAVADTNMVLSRVAIPISQGVCFPQKLIDYRQTHKKLTSETVRRHYIEEFRRLPFTDAFVDRYNLRDSPEQTVASLRDKFLDMLEISRGLYRISNSTAMTVRNW